MTEAIQQASTCSSREINGNYENVVYSWFIRLLIHTSTPCTENYSSMPGTVPVVACMLAKSAFCNPMNCSPLRLLHLWNFPGKNPGVDCHFLLQGIFPTQGSNPRLSCLLQWQVGFVFVFNHWRHLGSPNRLLRLQLPTGNLESTQNL